MTKVKRTDRLNSLLKEVLSEVVFKDFFNPDASKLITITEVDITRDLRQAIIYVSVIDTPEKQTKTLEALQAAAKIIGPIASKKVVMRYFPSLTFKLDNRAEHQIHINNIIDKIQLEREQR